MAANLCVGLGRRSACWRSRIIAHPTANTQYRHIYAYPRNMKHQEENNYKGRHDDTAWTDKIKKEWVQNILFSSYSINQYIRFM
jgi:hypothetical protein